MSFDIKIDPLTGDIYPDTVKVRGPEQVIQKIRIRLNRFFGEWVLDNQAGMRYIEFFEDKPTDEAVQDLAAAIRFEVESTPGVVAITSFEVSLTGETLSISGSGIVADDRNQQTLFQLDEVVSQAGLPLPRTPVQVV